MFGKPEKQQARVQVVSKMPDGLAYAPNSAISPVAPDADRLFRVLLRFVPRREHHHPDDNDLILSCDPALYAKLEEGAVICAVWEGKRLLSFEECS